jgi:HD-GYP domain-containing protein (c-di-GMP phosphodiesterase class II)
MSRRPGNEDHPAHRKPGPGGFQTSASARRSSQPEPRSTPDVGLGTGNGNGEPADLSTERGWLESLAPFADPRSGAPGSLPDRPAASSSLENVVAPCTEFLERAVSQLASPSAVLYAVEGPRRLTPLTSIGITDSAAILQAERAALAGIEASRPLLASGKIAEDSRRLLVVPCRISSDVVAVLVVSRPYEDAELVEEDLAKLGPTLEVALAADRARIHMTLEKRMSEAEGVRRQLEAYAVDLRSVYLSERARSEELGRALLELEETYEATVRGLAIAVEAKDEYTGGHLFRVSRYGMTMTAIVAPEHRDDPQFEYGFLLHDVGKLAVPDAVLAKTGTLTEEEWEQIRAHPVSGRTILEGIPFLSGASEIVYCHHERWDGKGFPRGLEGDEIPLGARIFPIADAFDAITTSRPYRDAMPMEHARREIVNGSGTQFWPDAVDAFMSISVDELEQIRRDTLGSSGW